jgi:hypothetical protein
MKRDARDRKSPARKPIRARPPNRPEPVKAPPKPHWDPPLRILSLDGVVVKRFHHKSPRQEPILDTFEELGWPTRIDSPFPAGDLEELHNAVNKLNHHQENALIHFRVDGKRTGVIWELATVRT